MSRSLRLVLCALTIAVVLTPLVAVLASGGTISGKVADLKGAAIVGASVTATDSITNQRFTTTTDSVGRYKIENLAPASYVVVVSAPGFAEMVKEEQRVEEGKTLALDFRLEPAVIESSVIVNVKGPKPNSDPVYQALRLQARNDQDFAGDYATVNHLVLNRDAAKFTLKSGEVYFLPPVEGRVTGAVFIGDGELNLTPPVDHEKRSLQIFTGEPSITEQFSSLVLRFTDQTADEIKKSPNAKMGTGGTQASSARGKYRDNQELLRKRLRDNVDIRTLLDLYAPNLPGYFSAFIDGRRFSKLVFLFDPLGIPQVSPEEVALFSYGETDGGFWTAFHRSEEYQKGTASSSEDRRVIDMTHHQIDASIKGTRIFAKDTITFKALVPGARVLSLNLYRTLRVSQVEDEQGNNLHFIQENKNEDADFGVVLNKPMEQGKSYKITVHYDGVDVLRDSGGGNFILIARTSWYPNNAGTQFGDRAIFDMTFRYPKGVTFVGTGAKAAPDETQGDQAISRWTSGTTELAVAGFNYGRFKKKELADKVTGYTIEFFANEHVPDELRAVQLASEGTSSFEGGSETTSTLGSISTTKIADAAIADTQNATRIFTSFFGKLAYTRIAMSQQPAGNFGQAWPTLVFMPYLAYIDTTQRVQLLGIRGGNSKFWNYVGPHEVAHQWWGHMVGWDSYRDQWMSEGFSQFSASLWIQATKGNNVFLQFWEDERAQIISASPQTRDRKPYTVGPVTQGYRLNSAKTGAVFQTLAYPKGGYILHMLRMMMYDRQSGDARFQAMMKDFLQTHFNQDISTEDLKRAVEKHMTPEMDIDKNKRMDWFFDEWVYGTEIPEYRFEYQISPDGTLNGKVTQSGVSDKFVMLVPVYLDFGKGWSKLGTVVLAGNSSVDLTGIKLPSKPKRATISAFNDVLATSVQVN